MEEEGIRERERDRKKEILQTDTDWNRDDVQQLGLGHAHPAQHLNAT